MEGFIICKNPLCLFVVDLRTHNGQALKLSELIISQCPECGNDWSSQCPFCANDLDVIWREHLPFCSRCLTRLLVSAAE